jgi:hypothetical protein
MFVPTSELCDGCTAGAGAAASVDALLAVLGAANPAATLNRAPFRSPSPGALFAAASVTATGVAASDTVSLTVVHAWHYPHFFWYRDSYGGSDNGNRCVAPPWLRHGSWRLWVGYP